MVFKLCSIAPCGSEQEVMQQVRLLGTLILGACMPWRRKASEETLARQGFVLGRSRDPPIEEATLEWGVGGREGRRGHCVYAGNQSPRLWLLVFRDKLISLIW